MIFKKASPESKTAQESSFLCVNRVSISLNYCADNAMHTRKVDIEMQFLFYMCHAAHMFVYVSRTYLLSAVECINDKTESRKIARCFSLCLTLFTLSQLLLLHYIVHGRVSGYFYAICTNSTYSCIFFCACIHCFSENLSISLLSCAPTNIPLTISGSDYLINFKSV